MPGATTEEIVESVLTTLKDAAATGDTSAIDELRRRSSADGTVGAETKTPTVPPPDKLTIKETYVTRPNGEKYYVRKVDGHHDIAMMRKAREINSNVLLYGPPGTGKTALIEAAYVDAGGRPVYTVQGSGDTETADFVGGYVQVVDPETGKATYVWVDGPLVLAMENGAVLYVDEIALIDPKVLALLYGVMDGRNELRITANPSRGVITSKPGFYVVSACNPNAPGARMSEALVSRFTIQFEVTTDYVLAKTMGVNPKMVTAANNLATKLAENKIGWAPQLRELIAFKQNEKEFGLSTAIRILIATAPEMDRGQVSEILSRNFAGSYKALKVSN